MAFIPTAQTAKVTVKALLHGTDCQSIFYALRAGGWDETSLASLGSVFAGYWQSQILPLVSSAYSLETVEARDVSDAEGAVIEHVVTGQKIGTNSSGGGPIPNSTSLAIKKNSPYGGKSGKGRIFFPITLTGMLDATGNGVSAGFATSIVEALTDVLTGVEGDATLDCDLGFVSFRTANGWRPAGVFRDILSFSYSDLTIDNQRRRLPGRGQ